MLAPVRAVTSILLSVPQRHGSRSSKPKAFVCRFGALCCQKSASFHVCESENTSTFIAGQKLAAISIVVEGPTPEPRPLEASVGNGHFDPWCWHGRLVLEV